MANKGEYPDWFLWLWEKWVVLFLVLGVLTLILIAGAVYLDNRFARFEDELKFVPPRSYQPPELSEYEAGKIDSQKLTRSGSIYAPCYSHIYYHGGSPLLLETTLSIRNINQDQPVYLTAINYVDTDGESIKIYLDQTIKLAPFQTIEFLVEEKDSTGGSGANFLVNWMAGEEVEPPLVETVMVGASGSRAIAFSRSGVPIPAGKSEN
ncbi:hypothetical protein Enr10x_39920 [Gimesia panareensis]|uniref:DUF3124 domain-containing protein n=1 Tax=Gimesia panareensis TaxID=2527978 RepID=A0A517QAI8_9PLAN|nr:DUF3124 domain-containing protein [Gimesia panareensis]QDT28648.1 hypothetical protein Enr10x_39920 [Gimesia panareensis]